MQAMLPVFVSLIFAGGRFTSVTFYPLIIAAAQLISMFVGSIILPGISVSAGLSLVNHISEKEYLGKFSKLLQKILSWGLKISAGIFMAILSLHRIGAPVLSQVAGKGAKAAIEAVPVVGDAMSGAIEIGTSLTRAVGNGVGAAAIIFLVAAKAVISYSEVSSNA